MLGRESYWHHHFEMLPVYIFHDQRTHFFELALKSLVAHNNGNTGEKENN